MEKKTIITDIATGKTIFSDYTADQIEALVSMDKDINAEIEKDRKPTADELEQQASKTDLDELYDAFDKYPKAKDYFADENTGEVPVRTAKGIIKLAEQVKRSITEVVEVFELSQGTPYLIPFSIMLEVCCEDSRL